MKTRLLVAVVWCVLGAGAPVPAPVHGNEPIRVAGDVLEFAIPLTGAAVSVGHRDHRGLLQLGKSLAISQGTTFVLKQAIPERRPNGGSRSFPSGHTAASFAGAGFLDRRYGHAWGIPGYVLAAFVGYSRVESRRHHLHDCLAGAAIGFGAARLVTTSYGDVAVVMGCSW